MIISGIDPGTTGAIAVIDEDGCCTTMDMPVIDGVVQADDIIHFLATGCVDFVVMEHAQSMPGNGGKSMFAYGSVFGQLLTMLSWGQFPYTLAKPSMWKRQMGLIKKGKDASRNKAIQLFPRSRLQFKLAKDHNRAEAALIAWWWLNHPLREEMETADDKVAA